jgi:hypothetical protein
MHFIANINQKGEQSYAFLPYEHDRKQISLTNDRHQYINEK